MGLELFEDKIFFKDREVGTYKANDNGNHRLELELPPEEMLTFLSGGSKALNSSKEADPPLIIGLDARNFELLDGVYQTLLEKQIKLKNQIWHFHKTDKDNWPSELHGHNQGLPQKVDAITGEIFDIHTKNLLGNIGKKNLQRLQAKLLESKDFKEKALRLF